MAKILLVDDEPGVRHVLVGILRQEKHEVTPAAYAEQAQDILQSEVFDLLLSDIMMEPIDGLELLKFARVAYPKMAVVLMTAHGSVEQAVESIHKGSFDYVLKPFKTEKLFSTIRRALESRPVSTAPSKEFSQFNRLPLPAATIPTTSIEEEWSFPDV